MSEKDNKPVIVINISRSFGPEGTGSTWTTSVPQETPLEAINEVNDRMMKALARQEIWVRISMLNNEIEQHAKQLAQARFSRSSMEKLHGDFSKASREVKQAYEQGADGISRVELLINALKEEQERLKGQLLVE